jgi:SAM-dependent methyltransferase
MLDVALKPLRAIYYRSQTLRRLPVGTRLRVWIQEWEEQKGKGDSPKARAAWEAQFEAGQWEYMARETARYAVIVGFMERFKGSGAILDIGCGQGFLYRRFRPYGYRRYVGVDISANAVAHLAEYADFRTQFIQGDGDTFEPDQPFDAIVLNESLYYLRDPLACLHRFARYLAPDGVLIVSNYTESRRARALLGDAVAEFTVVDEALTRQGKLAWRCVVLKAGAKDAHVPS